MGSINKEALELLVTLYEANLKALNELLGKPDGTVEAKKQLDKKSVAGKEKENGKQSAEKKKSEDIYENMKSADLYKLCCERGISSQCKERNKAYLIEVLRKNDIGSSMEEPESETDTDEWDDPEEEKVNPYVGKKAQELYKMCVDRGIKVEKKLKAEKYVELLLENDESSGDSESDEFDSEEWEI